MPSIEAKASTKRVETSNVKNKTLVKELPQVNPCNRGKVTNNESGNL